MMALLFRLPRPMVFLFLSMMALSSPDNIVYMTMTGMLRASGALENVCVRMGLFLPLFMDLFHLDSSSHWSFLGFN